jgi:hypothetical protein
MAAVSFVSLQRSIYHGSEFGIYSAGVCYISTAFLNVTVFGVLYEVRKRRVLCAHNVFQSVRLCYIISEAERYVGFSRNSL